MNTDNGYLDSKEGQCRRSAFGAAEGIAIMLAGYIRLHRTDNSEVREIQRAALLAAGVPPDRLYEDQVGDQHDGWPGLGACLESLKSGDVLLVWELNRLGRKLRRVVGLIHELALRDVGIRVLSGPGIPLDTTCNKDHVRALFGALAAFDRQAIVEHTKAGLVSARAAGRNGGRPFKMTPAQLREAQAALRRPGTRVGALCASLGITRQTLSNYMDAQGRLRPSGEKLLASARTADAGRPLPGAIPEAVPELWQTGAVA
jgi:DNA invertase Pin-like site-specific DNA recombinase